MSTVNLILQGKGGVGKSFAAFLLAQYLPEKSVLVRCFDADPINNTLASFAALNAVKVDLIETSDKGRRITFTRRSSIGGPHDCYRRTGVTRHASRGRPSS